MNSNTIIVDLQGFKDDNNKFIVKEVAIATKYQTQTFLVKPPYSYYYLTDTEKKRVQWLQRNRGIYWSEGYIDFKEFQRIIVAYLEHKTIFTKGFEKIQWIKELCPNCEVLDLSEKLREKGYSNFTPIYEKCCSESVSYNCVFHKKYCALKNVTCLRIIIFGE